MNKCLIAVIIFTNVLTQTNAQDTTSEYKEGIIAEINALFEKSRQAGERLDMSGITENVSDALAAGFIDNGIYFDSFDEVMKGFKNGIGGLASQKIRVAKKKSRYFRRAPYCSRPRAITRPPSKTGAP